MCLYGSGAEKVADTVNKDSTEEFTIDEAQAAITDYFATFYSLKNWLDSCKETILQQGYIYSAFGRKRRLKNVTSKDKNIVAHECRSGINFLVQSVCSDINLLAAIEFSQLIKKHKLKAKIIMLVHDSIVLEVADEDVELACSLLKVCTQKDRGVSIPGCPIGVDQEVGDDYSFGKFENKYGDLIQKPIVDIAVLGENISKIIEDIYDNVFEESEISNISSTKE